MSTGETARAWYQKNKKRIAARHAAYYQKNKARFQQRTGKWKKEHAGRVAELNKALRERLRRIVIEHYSNGKVRCACCGEEHIEFLTIDHVGGGGNKHRKEINNELYGWLRRNGYPKGFQVLCTNCNCCLGLRGYCPHKSSIPIATK